MPGASPPPPRPPSSPDPPPASTAPPASKSPEPDNAIQNQWLRVTLKGGTGSTSGLVADNVFFFGNALGDTGNDPTAPA